MYFKTVVVAALVAVAAFSHPGGTALAQSNQSDEVSDRLELPRIRLDVADFQVVAAYVPPRTHPFIEHTLPIKPLALLEKWGKDAIKAVGTEGKASLIIRKASVMRIPLRRKTGFKALFRRQPEARLDAVLEIELTVEGAGGWSKITVSASARASKTILEEDEPEKRIKMKKLLVRQVVAAAARQLDRQIRTNLKKLVK